MTRVVVAIGCLAACGGAARDRGGVRPAVATPPAPAVAEVYDPPPPTLRLPDQFRPERYTVRLAIDPALPTFAGQVVIDGDLTRASRVLWLHGKELAVHAATATSPDGTATDLAVTPRGEDLELRAARPLPAVTITSR